MASPRSRRESADYYRDRRRRKVCNFCVDKAESIDYKEVNRLRRYLSERAKIEPRRKTGTCARHQRMLTTALKRARHVALLPYAPQHLRPSGTPPAGPRGPAGSSQPRCRLTCSSP
jgi:small subunit ribosomal protein S18